MKNLNYLIDIFPYQISKIILKISSIKHGEKTDNPSIRIYENNIESSITFKLITWYYLEFLTLETMKLLGSTKNQITKEENGENVPYLEITEVV